jgi:hypothetical protein
MPMIMRTVWTVGASSLLLLATAAGATTPPRPSGAALFDEVRYAPTPDPDPFYAQPDPFPRRAPGTILKARRVQFRPGLSIPLPGRAWQLQYITSDVKGRRLAAVTTIVEPVVPSTAADKPLLSYQFAYDSLGSQCTPSRTLTGGTANYNNQAETLIYVLGHLALGWTIVLPDYEGPYSAWGAGRMSGQVVLDSIRATQNFRQLGLSKLGPVGLMGYSGGALASTWAASLAPSYAPGINIVGVAAGGVPADVFGIVQHVEGGPFMGLILGAIVGANRAYPGLMPEPILSDAGRAMFEEMKDGCVNDNTPLALFKTLRDFTTVADPYATRGAQIVRPLVTLPQPGHTPTADLFIYHETLDEIIPIAGTRALVKNWCDAGAHVSFLQGYGGEHVSGTVAYTPAALAYLTGRFAGIPLTESVDELIVQGAERCN